MIGVDFSPAMLARARRATRVSGLDNLHHYQAAAEALPLPGASVDVALVNGLFNLNPARAAIFQERAPIGFQHLCRLATVGTPARRKDSRAHSGARIRGVS